MNKVKGYRVSIGMTQIEMAQRLGITDTTYRKLENNPGKFSLQQMKAFIEIVREKDPSIKMEDIFLDYCA